MYAFEERTLEQTGWKRIPKCHFLLQSMNGKLYCEHDYDQFQQQVRESTVPEIFNDIGLNQSYREAMSKGEVVKECSTKECPILRRRLLNRIRLM